METINNYQIEKLSNGLWYVTDINGNSFYCTDRADGMRRINSWKCGESYAVGDIPKGLEIKSSEWKIKQSDNQHTMIGDRLIIIVED